MVSISPDDLALELLNQCLRGNAHSADLLETLVRLASDEDGETARRASHALFTVVVERLADQFEPCLCDSYAALFADVIARRFPSLKAAELVERYRRIRWAEPFRGDAARVRHVFVLSRVTLGADVAVTSLLLAAAKQRFPRAEIHFTGPRKNFELFAADQRVKHAQVEYRRGATLDGRLSVYPDLARMVDVEDGIIIDPDSRLTQLGLLPLGSEDRYFFFESRSYGGYGDDSLVTLAQRWAEETFSVSDVSAYVAPAQSAPAADAVVSLGVGENQAKRIGGTFEREVMEEIARTAGTVLVDRGGTEEEASRVDSAVAGLDNVRTFTGPFAPFAGAVAKSRLYFGYDSAGQHVAAACGTPLVTMFAGYASARMFHRWKPDGPGVREIIRAESQETAALIDQVRQSLSRLPRRV